MPDPERVARYAEAIYAEGAYCGDCEYLGWDECSQCRAVTLGYAKAAIALADEEHAALVAEVERLRRGGKTLGEIIDKQCRMVLDATGLHDWVDEDGDGDWGAIWDHLFALRSRAESAEVEVARLRNASKQNAIQASRADRRADRLEARAAATEAEVERLRGQVQRVRALADAFADDGLARYGGNIAWHIEEAIANEKGDFPDAADQRIASQRERAEAAEAKVERLRERLTSERSDVEGLLRVAAKHAAEVVSGELGPRYLDERLRADREEARAEAAEAKVAKVEALADELDEFAKNGEISSGIAMGWREGVRIAADNLRQRLAVLADAPAEQRAEGGA